MKINLKLLMTLFILEVVILFSIFWKSDFFVSVIQIDIYLKIHVIALLLWILSLIIQSILLKNEKNEAAVKLRGITYYLVPIFVITLFPMVEELVAMEVVSSQQEAVTMLFIAVLSTIFLFFYMFKLLLYIGHISRSFYINSGDTYYLFGMDNKPSIRLNTISIILISTIALSPVIFVFFSQFGSGFGLAGVILVPLIIPTIRLLLEIIKSKYDFFLSAYFWFIVLWIFAIILILTIPNTFWWKEFALKR